MNIKKLSATLLATTLAAAFALAPVTEVKAAQQPDWVREFDANGNPIDVIDRNVKKVRVEGVSTGDEASLLKAKADLLNKAVAQGILEETDRNDYDYYIELEDGEKTVTKYYKFINEGWSEDDDERVSDTSSDGKTIRLTYSFYYTEFKNSITGETSFDLNALKGQGYTESQKINAYPEKVRVYTGGTNIVYVTLGSGNIKLKKVKSSNKKVIKAKIVENEEYTTTQNYTFRKDSKGYYYESVAGEKVYVSSPTDKVNMSRAKVGIKLYGVKDGKATVSFDIYDINGSKTGKGKITVVSDTNLPIKDITFGGQSLEQGVKIGETNNNYIYKGKDFNTFYAYTKKKSGKLKVTTSKDYKIERIQVGKLEKYNWNTSQIPGYDSYYNYNTGDRSENNSLKIETTKPHPVDLNGDGDFKDIVNGMDESKVEFRFKTVKNGKKIKLSKIPSYTTFSADDSESYANNQDLNFSNSYKYNNKKAMAVAPTAIRVTLFNKVTKEYEIYTYYINLKIKKY
ncbi:hypothetical protein [Butyrivibrio sp. AC2005]|uniref:hypothetical protein n=1 Tax=Butyrivibrio sp. AC2005 TaxID=1280672 RepID=UPI00042860B0|nr:hypothetical protein [Butyrivibrio sp. AC2005]